ncbi:O-acetyl-ADP-ribose deacetylase [Deferrisoma camini]|uniref:O-acetyl-ADP-ribose deacetylase n=1 Tax=Deferrisoma camini TaxID=1035120 RepID=UPI00046C9E11|nr:O-acetyl-ADP-ribose deacetylase [Deferrisoma camini]
MERQIGNTRLVLVRGDITRQAVDAVVNAANPSLMGGGGVDGAIHRAGGPAILDECKKIVKKIGRLEPGGAVVTTAGNLPARHVIHTVGPVWKGGARGEPEVLSSAYVESLKRAEELGCRSVAFPSISTGAYGYPLEEAARVALEAVIAHLEEGSPLEEVRFVLFSDPVLAAYETALERLKP